jgi:hypothetical protein
VFQAGLQSYQEKFAASSKEMAPVAGGSVSWVPPLEMRSQYIRYNDALRALGLDASMVQEYLGLGPEGISIMQNKAAKSARDKIFSMRDPKADLKPEVSNVEYNNLIAARDAFQSYCVRALEAYTQEGALGKFTSVNEKITYEEACELLLLHPLETIKLLEQDHQARLTLKASVAEYSKAKGTTNPKVQGAGAIMVKNIDRIDKALSKILIETAKTTS